MSDSQTTEAAEPTSGDARSKTRRKRSPAVLEEELQKVTTKLHGIEAISRALGSEHNLERILDTVMHRTTELMNAERSTLYVFDDESGLLWSKVLQGGESETIYLKPGQGIAGWVAESNRCLNIKDAYKDPRFDPKFDQASGFKTTSVLCTPMVGAQGKTIGVIQVLNRKDGYFSTSDEDLLLAIGSQAAISIQNSMLYLSLVGKNIDLLDTQLMLEERTNELELLFAIERAASKATTVPVALRDVLSTTLQEFPSEALGVMFIDPHTGALHYGWIDGPEKGRLETQTSSLNEGLVGHVLLTGEPVTLVRGSDDHTDQELMDSVNRQFPDWEIKNITCVPVTHKGKVMGCLQLVNRTDGSDGSDSRDVRLLGMVGRRLALALVIARSQEEEQKQDRLSAIGQMLSGVVHDLSTPLTIINGYGTLMAREDEGDARKGYKKLIDKQIGLMKTMTSELLAFARGDSTIFLRKIMVGRFISELEELLSEVFSSAGVTLVVETPYRGALRMDEGKMKRVVYNLARNALEAMNGQEDGQFKIRVEKIEGIVQLSFSDNGPGIPEALSGRLFEAFVSYGKENGTGLGLALVKKIVDDHDAQITVSSPPDEGTTFTVSFPEP